MQRRTFLAATSTLLTTTVAGCSDDSGSDPDEQATPADNNDTGTGNDTSSGSTPEPTNSPTGTPEQSAEAEREAIGYPSEYIEVRDVSWNPPEDEYSGPSVTGIVDNVSGGELSYVEVQIQAFNSDDTQLGDAMDNVTDLRGDKSWQFDCGFYDVEESEVDYWMGRAEVSNY